jgi:hypothetical protein
MTRLICGRAGEGQVDQSGPGILGSISTVYLSSLSLASRRLPGIRPSASQSQGLAFARRSQGGRARLRWCIAWDDGLGRKTA